MAGYVSRSNPLIASITVPPDGGAPGPTVPTSNYRTYYLLERETPGALLLFCHSVSNLYGGAGGSYVCPISVSGGTGATQGAWTSIGFASDQLTLWDRANDRLIQRSSGGSLSSGRLNAISSSGVAGGRQELPTGDWLRANVDARYAEGNAFNAPPIYAAHVFRDGTLVVVVLLNRVAGDPGSGTFYGWQRVQLDSAAGDLTVPLTVVGSPVNIFAADPVDDGGYPSSGDFDGLRGIAVRQVGTGLCIRSRTAAAGALRAWYVTPGLISYGFADEGDLVIDDAAALWQYRQDSFRSITLGATPGAWTYWDPDDMVVDPAVPVSATNAYFGSGIAPRPPVTTSGSRILAAIGTVQREFQQIGNEHPRYDFASRRSTTGLYDIGRADTTPAVDQGIAYATVGRQVSSGVYADALVAIIEDDADYLSYDSYVYAPGGSIHDPPFGPSPVQAEFWFQGKPWGSWWHTINQWTLDWGDGTAPAVSTTAPHLVQHTYVVTGSGPEQQMLVTLQGVNTTDGFTAQVNPDDAYVTPTPAGVLKVERSPGVYREVGVGGDGLAGRLKLDLPSGVVQERLTGETETAYPLKVNIGSDLSPNWVVGAWMVPVPTTPADPTISIVDSFNRADTTAGTLGTTSDGLATWVPSTPGAGFRILSNAAGGSLGTHYATVDALGTAPGIVSGKLLRVGSPTQGGLGLVYGLSGTSSSDFACYRLTRFLGFADLFHLQVVVGGSVVQMVVELFNQGFADNPVGLRVNANGTIDVFLNGALHSTYTPTASPLPPASSKHGLYVSAQVSCAADDWAFAKDA